MQTKKKVTARNSARELASPKVSRHLKKVSESAQVQERNVTELITSSARKQRVGKLISWISVLCYDSEDSPFSILAYVCREGWLISIAVTGHEYVEWFHRYDLCGICNIVIGTKQTENKK